MKAQKILIAQGDDFSRGAMEEKVLERGNDQDAHRINGKQRYLLFQRGLFIALILLLLALFIIRISAAQEPFPKMNRPNLRIMDNRGTCLESLSPSLTEAQKKALENLRIAYMAEARPIKTDLFALKIHLRYLLSDPNVQSRILFDQQRKISALQAKVEELSLSYQVKARAVFTKDQLERLPQGWAFEMGLGHEIRPAGSPSRLAPPWYSGQNELRNKSK